MAKKDFHDLAPTEKNIYDSLGPGKFEGGGGRLEKELYELAMNGTEDAGLGDSESFGYYWKFDGVKIGKIRRPFFAILSTNSSGTMYVSEYEDHDELEAAWTKLEAEEAEFFKDVPEGL